MIGDNKNDSDIDNNDSDIDNDFNNVKAKHADKTYKINMRKK